MRVGLNSYNLYNNSPRVINRNSEIKQKVKEQSNDYNLTFGASKVLWKDILLTSALTVFLIVLGGVTVIPMINEHSVRDLMAQVRLRCPDINEFDKYKNEANLGGHDLLGGRQVKAWTDILEKLKLKK